ncbi:hypothetical protein [Dactylosporangium matsuzakiense]|uniref:hypothetical protein n=1 Tax=Dactylosporangium matsuzakiense TaxID=53360 RepID=UPI0022F33E4C|nr:hypothetical protein [Dactylosporangium matsuzakiense]
MRFYAVDLLYLDDTSTLDLPYAQRRELLDSLGLPDLTGLPDATPHAGPAAAGVQPLGTAGAGQRGIVAYLPRSYTDGPGTVAARAFALEGIVAKRADSVYRPGDRSRDWVKRPSVGEPGCSARSAACDGGHLACAKSATGVADRVCRTPGAAPAGVTEEERQDGTADLPAAVWPSSARRRRPPNLAATLLAPL